MLLTFTINKANIILIIKSTNPLISSFNICMAQKVRSTFFYIVTFIFFFVILAHYYYSHDISTYENILNIIHNTTITSSLPNLLLHENISSLKTPSQKPFLIIPSVSILMPDWEIYVIVLPDYNNNILRNILRAGSEKSDISAYLASNKVESLVSPDYSPLKTHFNESLLCVFDTGEESLATPAGALDFPARSIYKCELPIRARKKLPFKQPHLVSFSSNASDHRNSTSPELLRWTFLVYDSLTTDNDVVLFVKGLNNHRRSNRDPKEFNCIFGNAVRTAVKSSVQEVFRCNRPELAAGKVPELMKVSIEIMGPTPIVVPTVAYYMPPRTIASSKKAKLCVCTMVYNVGKFLREWVIYHFKIGVEKFILYDNGSDDDLDKIVDELVQQGYDVKTYFWLWPKTQEAGFSHSAIFAKDSCSWMMYIDVDEFVYSQSWSNLSQPSKSLLPSILPKFRNFEDMKVAQVRIPCYEFGPSNQEAHPKMGVIQGYNCRRKKKYRHKSIVFLDGVDYSLRNVIHHFNLTPGYREKELYVSDIVVNHYKYQAWPEFKAKFRRRVSTYVVDWTEPLNLGSNDRTPGLGSSPVEPKGWKEQFCEVYDNGLKDLTWRWFAVESPTSSEYHMPWH